MKALILVLLLTGCGTITPLVKGAQSAEDANLQAWRFDACATPLSAIIRNAQAMPNLVSALSLLCVPGVNDSAVTLLNQIPRRQ